MLEKLVKTDRDLLEKVHMLLHESKVSELLEQGRSPEVRLRKFAERGGRLSEDVVSLDQR